LELRQYARRAKIKRGPSVTFISSYETYKDKDDWFVLRNAAGKIIRRIRAEEFYQKYKRTAYSIKVFVFPAAKVKKKKKKRKKKRKPTKKFKAKRVRTW